MGDVFTDFDKILIDIFKDDYISTIRVPDLYRRYLFCVKDELLSNVGQSVGLEEFVRDVFPGSSLQSPELKAGESDGKGCVLITTRKRYTDNTGKLRQREVRKLVKSDYKGVDAALKSANYTSLIFPFTVFGKRHRKENAHELHAITIDIDYVWEWHLRNLLRQMETGRILTPSYITNSGNGVHLWYVLQEPVNLTIRQGQELVMLKKMLMHFIWNEYTSAAGNDRDSANIYQGFRLPGVFTKLAFTDEGKALPEPDSFRASVYRMTNGRKYTVRELYSMLSDNFRKHYVAESIDNFLPNLDIIEAKYPWDVEGESKHTLAEAKLLYPDWYAETIEGKKLPYKKRTKDWICSEKLYDWWLGKMEYEAKVGGRYWAIRALVQYGVKCGIPESKIRADARSMLEKFDSLSISNNPADRFTWFDVECALDALNDDITRKKQSTRAFISETTKIEILPAKRNGRKRQEHLQAEYWETRDKNGKVSLQVNLCRANRELALRQRRENGLSPDEKKKLVGEWIKNHPDGTKTQCVKALEGQVPKPTVYKLWKEFGAVCNGVIPDSKQKLVDEWRNYHPDGTKAACIRDTGLSKPTVYKWWM